MVGAVVKQYFKIQGEDVVRWEWNGERLWYLPSGLVSLYSDPGDLFRSHGRVGLKIVQCNKEGACDT